MGLLPRVIGGVGGVGSDDYIVKYEQALAGAHGEGLYNPDSDSSHGRHRRPFATVFARIRSRIDTLFAESIPTRSFYALDLWEYVYGLDPVPPEEWDVGRRRQRLRARILERKGNNPAVLKLVFETLTGRTCHVHSPRVDVAHGVPSLADPACRFYVTVLVPQEVYDDRALWAECLKTARRRQPSHGLISVAVTADTAYSTQPEFRCGTSHLGRDTLGRDVYA